ncbi:hypothetical protein [Nonomuraea sp. SBT364]|uniref:hypothetical protein n=1 Tax=Nonomuraea sp. SBT364 TaxID=1580530 RepID=UPI00066C894D|nr:hypothetical protein [Nonomuraea sp. SBT364]
MTGQDGTPARRRRSRLLLGAVSVAAGAALVAAGTAWWQGGGAPAATSAVVRPLPATGSPAATTPDARSLATALRQALARTPMADFAYEGGLSQSDFYADARGRLVHAPGGADLAMTVTSPASEGEPAEVTVRRGRPGEARPGVADHARVIAVLASARTAAELADATTGLTRTGDVYRGEVPAAGAPQHVQHLLREIAGGWSEEELARSTLVWTVTLGERGLPARFAVEWRAPIQGAVLTSSWTTAYSGWRAGTIAQ